MSDLTGLELLELTGLTDVDTLSRTIEDIAQDYPAVALAMAAMTTFLTESEEDLATLYEETLDLRRSHIMTFAALLDGVRSRITGLLDASALEVWADDDGGLVPAVDALTAAGEPIRDLVAGLHEDLSTRQART